MDKKRLVSSTVGYDKKNQKIQFSLNKKKEKLFPDTKNSYQTETRDATAKKG